LESPNHIKLTAILLFGDNEPKSTDGGLWLIIYVRGWILPAANTLPLVCAVIYGTQVVGVIIPESIF